MTKWAVFDVDGTLLPGISMEQLFIRYCRENRLIPPVNFFLFVLTAMKILLRGKISDMFKTNKALLTDLPVDKVETAAAICFDEMVKPLLSDQGGKVVDAYRREGYKILVMTGSPYFIAQHLIPIYHPDELIGFHLEISEGFYTGKGIGLHPYARRKKEVLLNLREKLDLHFEGSAVFANHYTDVYHMELFGEAVVVNPTPKLRKIAEKRRWKIEAWE
jgi:phosphoserine phosphatase